MAHYITLDDAAALVPDGATLALGGMTVYRRPAAFVRALLRRSPRPRALTLLCFTAGYESDLLVGAGCVALSRSAYFGLESFGFAPMFTQAVQEGRLSVLEETEASIVLGLRAAIAGVGFMPSTAWLGTDLLRLRPDVRTVLDPYSGQELTAFPAIAADVAVLHGLAGDAQGSVMLNNNLGIDLELVYAADTVIVTVEQLVESLRPDPAGTIIPHAGVDYVVHLPQGARPTSCYPLYPVDGHELMRYVDACYAGQFEAYLAEILAEKPQ